MTPYTCEAIEAGMRRWLEPYGFHSFQASRLCSEDIIDVRMRWGTEWFSAGFSAKVADDPPWQTVDPVGAWIESMSRTVLNATWSQRRASVAPPVRS